MPKENINPAREYDDYGNRMSALEVGWSSSDVHLTATAWYDRNEREQAVAVCLDRDGINRLIRSLRKARDRAFGSDA